ncbi:UDP-3-O-(3-hydroxymyristoyl)glucosamine N-acyltransferase [Candidatus Protochlamydia sp. R18]|uniref:UDP-3-O-(3-hydroxymyristoyl)glucosamine N-acyltransferase n=1 Tax=Candidatus Protochlamydia sp. R18 TaxID=1353977 RepID=UPI0005AA96AC|nr:UDP-3-O-(3-hydroxymyristoyl)glucosamine N-acyltransferase [Candidatus Protochlamydia sp. R18]
MNEKKHFTLQELALLTDCKLVGNPSQIIKSVADLENASEEDASFFANNRYLQSLKESQAGVVFVDLQTPLIEGKNYLLSENPSRSFQHLIDTLYPQKKHPSGFTGIHTSAVIHPTAEIGNKVTICPQAVIDEGVKIGSGSFIGAGVYIGSYSEIGEDCTIHPRVVIREKCYLGNRVILQPGVVIGSCGFGYTTNQQGQHIKLNQVGNVWIENDVEIGANTTIDRARFKSTRIGQGTKIDNLVQIAHGVTIGSYNIIVSQTGIAGSTTTGKYVVIAGQAAIAGHLHLKDHVVVAGKSGVTKSLSTGKYSGIPAMPIKDYNRNQVFLRKIEIYINQIKNLEKRVLELESQN